MRLKAFLPLAVLLSAGSSLAGCATVSDPATEAASASTPTATSVATVAPLTIAGAQAVVELSPVLLAVDRIYPAGTKIANGGVPNLISDTPVDIATNAETQLLRQSVKRPDLRAIMTIVEGDYRIVARKSAGISKLADLKGKRIAVMNATSSEYFLVRMLASVGLTQGDVQQIHVMPLSDMVTKIAAKEIDAVAIWEPASENAARAIGSDLIEFSGKGIYRELFNMNSRVDVLQDPVKRAEVVKFLREIIRATAAMKQDPTRAQQLMAASGNYTVEELQHAWKHHTWLAGFAPDMLDVLVEEEKWLASVEKRPARTREQLANLIDRSVYDEAVAGL